MAILPCGIASTPVCAIADPNASRSTSWPGAMSLCATADAEMPASRPVIESCGAADAGTFCTDSEPAAFFQVVPAATRLVATTTCTARPPATAR